MSLLIIVLLITVVAVTVVALLWRRAQRRMARARAQAAWLNRELERTDSQLEAVEIWSDEQIERNDRELGDSILERVGRDLAADASPEAGRLRTFLPRSTLQVPIRSKALQRILGEHGLPACRSSIRSQPRSWRNYLKR